MRRLIYTVVACGALLLATASAAAACPVDGGGAPQGIKDHFCGAWNAAEARGLNMGSPANDAHRWGNGWVRDFHQSTTFGSGVLMEGDGVGYAYIVGNPRGQWYWDAFKASGDVSGLGYPVGRQEFGGHLNDGPRGNRYMTFQDGVINSWSGGTFASHGAIWRKWNATGHVSGPLGLPLSNEYATAARGGAAQRFEGGYITHNPAIPGEFVTLNGPIADKYVALGASRSFLGLPTSDQFQGERGNQVQRFDDGQITAYAGGTFETHGLIFARWAASKASNGVLGFPTSDEYATAAGGGAASKFEHGVITYNPRTGHAYVSAFAILDKYASLGASRSYLGLPTSEEYDVSGGKRQNFDGGYIEWHPGWASARSNRELSGRPRYVIRALGDSISAGFGLQRGAAEVAGCAGLLPTSACDYPYGSWPNVAVARLARGPLARYTVNMSNLAVSGSTTSDWRSGRPRGHTSDFRSRFSAIVRAQPNIVLMTLGANDLLGDPRCAASASCAPDILAVTEPNLVAIYKRLVRETRARIYVMKYYPVGGDRINVVEMLNRVIVRAARRAGPRVHIVAPPSFSGHTCSHHPQGLWMLGYDVQVHWYGYNGCLHPNSSGVLALANAAIRQIQADGP